MEAIEQHMKKIREGLDAYAVAAEQGDRAALEKLHHEILLSAQLIRDYAWLDGNQTKRIHY
jgi:hypothetical protein